MNCLSDELIQSYIDKEVSIEQETNIEAHLADCSGCRNQVESRKQLARDVKSSLDGIVDQIPGIPEFRLPVKHTPDFRKIFFRVFYTLAAASILLLFLSWPFNKEYGNEPGLYMFSEFDVGIDANLPISEQEFSIVFAEENEWIRE